MIIHQRVLDDQNQSFDINKSRKNTWIYYRTSSFIFAESSAIKYVLQFILYILIEIIGIYTRDIKHCSIFWFDFFGLYRDDGLGIIRTKSARTMDRMRKDIIQVFKGYGFQIEIEINLHEVNFLDVTFNLKNESYNPYKKPNDTFMYIDTSSNHPHQILKQLPSSINQRLSKNSSSEVVFYESKQQYIEALEKCRNKKSRNNRSRVTAETRQTVQFKVIVVKPPSSTNVT